MPRMLTSRLLLPALVLAVPAFGQTAPTAVDIANMREDIQGLTQRVNDLGLRVEQLEHENEVLHQGAESANRSYATVAQLNDAIGDLNRTVQAAIASSKSETLQLVGTQMEKLARQTNAALDSLTKGEGPAAHAAAAAPAAFGADYPK
jgi:cell division protein FtsB